MTGGIIGLRTRSNWDTLLVSLLERNSIFVHLKQQPYNFLLLAVAFSFRWLICVVLQLYQLTSVRRHQKSLPMSLSCIYKYICLLLMCFGANYLSSRQAFVRPLTSSTSRCIVKQERVSFCSSFGPGTTSVLEGTVMSAASRIFNCAYWSGNLLIRHFYHLIRWWQIILSL